MNLRVAEVVLLKCQGGDSNPYGFLHQILSLARLPIPPPRPTDYEAFISCGLIHFSLCARVCARVML